MEPEDFSEIELIEAKDSFIKGYRAVLNNTIRINNTTTRSEFDPILRDFYKDWFVIRTIGGEHEQNQLFSIIYNTQFNDENDVDELIKDLHVNHGFKKLVSLCPKTAFIFHPDRFLPFDKFAFKGLKHFLNLAPRVFRINFNNENYVSYNIYMQKIREFQEIQKDKILEIDSNSRNVSKIIEKEFLSYNLDFDKIRFNRITDKLLWTKGKILSNK